MIQLCNCFALIVSICLVGSAPSLAADCNGNGVEDTIDLQNGTSSDCDGNAVPDECDLQPGVGQVAAEQEIGDMIGGFPVDLEEFDRFGISLSPLGDLNGDGVPELVVGAPGDDDAGPDAGAVYVLYPTADGMVSAFLKITENQGGFTAILDPSDRFGHSIATIGDLDADGVVDIAVGAPGDDDGGSDHGAVWIILLNSGGTVKSQSKVSSLSGGFTGTLAAFDFFGESVAALGDLNGDMVQDLAVGARGTDDGAMDAGAVWILFLDTLGGVSASQKISATAGNFTGNLGPTDWFGRAVTSAGDLNGDGTSDLAVGAPLDDDGAMDAGAVWLLHLQPSGAVLGSQKISNSSGGLTTPLAAGDAFGSSLAGANDLDGNGTPDLLVGAPRDDDGGMSSQSNRGAVWTLLLATNGSVIGQRKISDTEGGFEGTLQEVSSFGAAVTAIHDIDGDGTSDLVVGAVGDFPNTSFGSIWILFPSATADDCNGNGVPDLCDIANATSDDLDGDLVPDECSGTGNFERGDCNGDNATNITDAVFLLGYLFPAGAPPALDCGDACDANDDGSLNLSDVIVLLSALFGMPPGPLPGPSGGCGVDPTPGDALSCTLPCI